MPDERLGPYFTWREMEKTTTGHPNVAPASARGRLQRLHDQVLHPLRVALGLPVRVSSGFRSAAVNDAVGGAENSAHMLGAAADIFVDGMTAEQLARRIIDLGLPFHQLIWYAPAAGGQVHVEIDPRGGTVLHSPRPGVYERRAPR
jgi:zinc D-Ala-D-Ala carboxypeptidase